MNITTTTAAIALTAPSIVSSLKGKGKAARTIAFTQIAANAMIDTLGRADLIASLKAALGTTPNEAELKAAQVEVTIGRVAARLPVGEMPKGTTDDGARLEFARDLVLHYAAPAQEGKAARKLRAGQKGRRSIVQHKLVRAADEAWSQLKAEIGAGNAKPQAVKNAAKRAPSMAGTGKGASKDVTPTHAELVKPTTPMSADEACAHVMAQATTLLAFGSKYAALLPTDFGTAIQAFKSAINKAANAKELRKVEAKGAK